MPQSTRLTDASTMMAAALLVVAAALSPLWSSLARLSTGAPYDSERARLAFRGIEVDAIAAHLDASTAPGVPLALDETLAADPFVMHRLTEGLYPRPVTARETARASFMLTSAPSPVPGLASPLPAGSYSGRNLALVTRPGAPPPPLHPKKRSDSAGSIAWLRMVDSLLSVLGLGALAWLGLNRFARTQLPALPGLWVLLAAIVLAVKSSVQTWLQVPWAGFFPGFGVLISVALAGWAVMDRQRRQRWRKASALVNVSLEGILCCALMAAILVRQFFVPVHMWDGRSIWMFAAHRLQHRGMLAVADITAPETLWSNPDYPLLHGAWLAFWAGPGEVFHERMAAAGAGILLAAVVAVLWRLARVELDRHAGAMFVAALVLVIDRLSMGLYADGLLALLLTVEVLAFVARDPKVAPIAWIAACAASLTKTEGFVLAFMIAVVFVVLHPAWRVRSRTMRLACFAVFLPWLGHRLWMSSQGLQNVTHGMTLAGTIANFLPRLTEAGSMLPGLLRTDGYCQLRGALWIGVLGLLAAVAELSQRLFVARSGPGRVPATALLTFVCAILAIAFALGAISALTADVRWLVGTALDRLLLHGALLAALAGVLALRPEPR